MSKEASANKFEEFYALYPRKKSRGDAVKAWGQALKKGHRPEEILAGLRRNFASMKMKDPQFVPYPATWLRAEGWADEPDVVHSIKVRPAQRPSGGMAGFMAARQETQNAWTLDAEFTRTADRDAPAFALEHAPYGRGH